MSSALTDCRALSPGCASGVALVLDEPLSFYGGVDDAGTIADVHHPQLGSSVVGKVLFLPTGRGSSSSASSLAELIRAGAGPAAIVLGRSDPIIAMGAIVALELYELGVPVLVAPFVGRFATGDLVLVEATPDSARVQPM